MPSDRMDVVLRTGFQTITHSIPFNPQGIIKGEELAVFHVRRVEELKSSNVMGLIRCSVIRQTSVTMPPYEVQLEIDQRRHVQRATCTCVSKAAEKCKHIYGLIAYINKDRSSTKTSLDVEWGKPSARQLGKDLYAKPILVTDRFKSAAAPNFKTVVPYELKLSDIALINCPLKSILKKESESLVETTAKRFVHNLLKLVVEEILVRDCKASAEALIQHSHCISYSTENVIMVGKLGDFYNSNIKLTGKEIVYLCTRTLEQSNVNEWFMARRLRISASKKAHSIKTCSRKDCITLAKDFVKCGPQKSCKSLEYGKKHEKRATADYCSANDDVKVVNIGLFVKPSQPWLCASVDGLVVQDNEITKVLEIKCPSSCSTKPVYDCSLKSFNVPYLYNYKNNVLLNENHIYYTQCQVSLYVVGLSVCDFFVWSPKGSILTTIYLDEEFLTSIIPKLRDFYFSYHLKQLVENDSDKENSNIFNNSKDWTNNSSENIF